MTAVRGGIRYDRRHVAVPLIDCTPTQEEQQNHHEEESHAFSIVRHAERRKGELLPKLV